MFRRLTLPVTLILAGFVAGLVVTGRMRTAADSIAAERAPSAAPDLQQRASAPPPPTTTAPAPAAAQTNGFSGGGPDFTRVAGSAIKGVANISSLQVVRTRNSPFPNDPF